MRRALIFAAFVVTVWAANYAIRRFGLVPVGFGLSAPAGVYFAGLGLLLRDALHELAGRWWVVAAIVTGAALSYLLGGGTIPGGHVSVAVASGVAFLLSETADFAVYTPLRGRTVAGGVAASQVVGAAVDSALFLWLAFGSLAYFAGQMVGKTLLVLPAVVLLAWWRYMGHGRRALAQQQRNFDELVKVNNDLYRLLCEHHSVGAMAGLKVGDECPVCAKYDVPRIWWPGP